MSISADLRRLSSDPRLRRISNLSSTGIVGVPYALEDSFGETLSHVMASVRPWKNALWGVRRLPALPPWLLRSVLKSVLALSRRSPFLPTMMNVGVLDGQRLIFGVASPTAVQILGPIPHAGGLAATVSTYRDTLTISMSAYARTTAPEVLEQALQGMDAELPVAI